MSEQPRKVVPAQLGFLAIYNPSLGTTDETIENQIVYYWSPESRGDRSRKPGHSDPKAIDDAIREQNNERLRQIGLAQGMVEFARSFSDGRPVDTIETEKSRIVLHELEAGWWILASINLTILPATIQTPASKGKAAEEKETTEYSSREVKPPILLLRDLLQAHSIFLLHHAASMSALFARTRRAKFMAILGRYWDVFLSTWNVLIHGNPANSLYGGIKIAACGELGMGVGEEERGSGEREVLEGFVGRVEGLVDVIVSKFGDGEPNNETETAAGKKAQSPPKPTAPWLGSGDDPAAEDGVIFLGTGYLSRKSLRDVSHWVEDLYRWGPHAYGVGDNSSSNRPTKTSKSKIQTRNKQLSSEARQNLRRVYGLSIRDKVPKGTEPLQQSSLKAIPPKPIDEEGQHDEQKLGGRRPSSRDSDSNKANTLVQYLKFGYGTHWSLGGGSVKVESPVESRATETPSIFAGEVSAKNMIGNDKSPEALVYPRNDSDGHFLIGLMGNMEDEEDPADEDPESILRYSVETDGYNARLVLRTLTLELEREEDARAEADISTDLGVNDDERVSFKNTGFEHTETFQTSFENQDRNKTKKLRVVVYVKKPFIFVFLFELSTDALTSANLYRSLHYQIGPLHKPLLNSTSYRASKPDVVMMSPEDAKAPIYDLIYDPKLLTINSTIPNIPDPLQMQSKSGESSPWSRIEALHTHMQIINTYITTTTHRAELERTCKTNRGWWVVWTRVPDSELSTTSITSSKVKATGLIADDSLDSAKSMGLSPGSGASCGTFGASPDPDLAHPFLQTPSNANESCPKDKEIFLIRRASDYVPVRSSRRFASGSMSDDTGWAAGPGKLAQGIGVDTKRYIEGLLNLNR